VRCVLVDVSVRFSKMRFGVVMGSKRTVWEVHDFVAMGFERYVNHTSLVFPSFFRLFLKILLY
jgi:hypothetical protein